MTDYAELELRALANRNSADPSLGTGRTVITNPEAQRLIQLIQRSEDPIWSMIDGIAKKASKKAMKSYAGFSLYSGGPSYYDLRLLIRDLEK